MTTIINEKLSKALDLYFKNCYEIAGDIYNFSYRVGGKNIKVIMEDKNGGYSKSVHSFISLETGDIFKPASWNAPAKGKRGNIYDEDGGRKALTRYGIIYLK